MIGNMEKLQHRAFHLMYMPNLLQPLPEMRQVLPYFQDRRAHVHRFFAVQKQRIQTSPTYSFKISTKSKPFLFCPLI